MKRFLALAILAFVLYTGAVATAEMLMLHTDVVAADSNR
jgi:hypothetical protein